MCWAGATPDIPLIMNVNKGGAVPAAGRPVTPEQAPILQQMRDSMRDPMRASMRDTASS